MSKIFEAFENEPMSQPNGDRSVLAGETDRFRSRRVAQMSSVILDGTADGTARSTVVAPPALEMDQATRQELTRLIQNLFLRPGGSRIVAFSGVQPGVGCSWLLARIAEVLADASAGSVCVVDANFRSPVLHTSFNTEHGRGFSDALVGSDPISTYVQSLGGGRLHLLSSGSVGEKAEPLLASTAFRVRVGELRAEFDYVLFDTAPLACRSDALAIASRIDGLALVVEADSTHRETALKVAKDAAAANVRMLGVVLNKRTYPIPAALYKKL